MDPENTAGKRVAPSYFQHVSKWNIPWHLTYLVRTGKVLSSCSMIESWAVSIGLLPLSITGVFGEGGGGPRAVSATGLGDAGRSSLFITQGEEAVRQRLQATIYNCCCIGQVTSGFLVMNQHMNHM
jgi:hypothetical protein